MADREPSPGGPAGGASWFAIRVGGDFPAHLCYAVAMRFALVFVLAIAAGCHHDPQPMHPAPGDLPPLPPASGTPVGYLIDSSSELKLTDDQLTKLKDIDASLSAKNADLDVQLRQIEKPEEDEALSPQEQKAGVKRQRHNHAPGADIQTNANAARLHQLHNANDKDALKRAWAVLDADQQVTAKKILEDRDIEVPGTPKKTTAADDSAGKPVPGLEP